MDGRSITASIKTATKERASEAGANAREALWSLVTHAEPIPKRQSKKYYAWLADEVKYDTHFRWGNGSFRKAGVWSSLGGMNPKHVAPFALALRILLDTGSNLADRPVLHFACADNPASVLDVPPDALVTRLGAIAILCMAPQTPTRAFATKLKKLAREDDVMVGAHHVCRHAPETVLYWDVELAHGLFGLLAVEGSKQSKAAVRVVLSFAENDDRTGRNVMSHAEAARAAAAY